MIVGAYICYVCEKEVPEVQGFHDAFCSDQCYKDWLAKAAKDPSGLIKLWYPLQVTRLRHV